MVSTRVGTFRYSLAKASTSFHRGGGKCSEAQRLRGSEACTGRALGTGLHARILCMADFRVFASGVSTFYSGEAARYEVGAGGVLTVIDGKGTRFQFSPSGWLSVEDQPEVDSPEVEFRD